MTRPLNTEYIPASGWRPDLRFWATHLLLPLAALAVLAILLETTGFELWLTDRWYAAEGGYWSLRHHWLTYVVMHHYGKRMVLMAGLTLFILILASFRVPALRRWRRPLTYLLTCMAVLPAIIAKMKHASLAPCPWDLARYGGDFIYHHTLSYGFGSADSGGCFPSGHASGGFGMIAAYFAAYLYAPRRWLFLLPGLVVGTLFALGQQLRGAHFISHDLWTLAICWFGALGLFLLFRPWNWPAPKAVENA